jgi:phage FluMu protein Com
MSLFIAKKEKYMKTESRYLCPHCKKMVETSTKPKRSFMGFLRIICPTCTNEFRYPLTSGYVRIYWMLLAANVILITYLLSQGATVIPNPIGIIVLVYVIVSLVKNNKLKREIAELEKIIPDE